MRLQGAALSGSLILSSLSGAATSDTDASGRQLIHRSGSLSGDSKDRPPELKRGSVLHKALKKRVNSSGAPTLLHFTTNKVSSKTAKTHIDSAKKSHAKPHRDDLKDRVASSSSDPILTTMRTMLVPRKASTSVKTSSKKTTAKGTSEKITSTARVSAQGQVVKTSSKAVSSTRKATSVIRGAPILSSSTRLTTEAKAVKTSSKALSSTKKLSTTSRTASIIRGAKITSRISSTSSGRSTSSTQHLSASTTKILSPTERLSTTGKLSTPSTRKTANASSSSKHSSTSRASSKINAASTAARATTNGQSFTSATPFSTPIYASSSSRLTSSTTNGLHKTLPSGSPPSSSSSVTASSNVAATSSRPRCRGLLSCSTENATGVTNPSVSSLKSSTSTLTTLSSTPPVSDALLFSSVSSATIPNASARANSSSSQSAIQGPSQTLAPTKAIPSSSSETRVILERVSISMSFPSDTLQSGGSTSVPEVASFTRTLPNSAIESTRPGEPSITIIGASGGDQGYASASTGVKIVSTSQPVSDQAVITITSSSALPSLLQATPLKQTTSSSNVEPSFGEELGSAAPTMRSLSNAGPTQPPSPPVSSSDDYMSSAVSSVASGITTSVQLPSDKDLEAASTAINTLINLGFTVKASPPAAPRTDSVISLSLPASATFTPEPTISEEPYASGTPAFVNSLELGPHEASSTSSDFAFFTPLPATDTFAVSTGAFVIGQPPPRTRTASTNSILASFADFSFSSDGVSTTTTSDYASFTPYAGLTPIPPTRAPSISITIPGIQPTLTTLRLTSGSVSIEIPANAEESIPNSLLTALESASHTIDVATPSTGPFSSNFDAYTTSLAAESNSSGISSTYTRRASSSATVSRIPSISASGSRRFSTFVRSTRRPSATYSGSTRASDSFSAASNLDSATFSTSFSSLSSLSPTALPSITDVVTRDYFTLVPMPSASEIFSQSIRSDTSFALPITTQTSSSPSQTSPTLDTSAWLTRPNVSQDSYISSTSETLTRATSTGNFSAVTLTSDSYTENSTPTSSPQPSLDQEESNANPTSALSSSTPGAANLDLVTSSSLPKPSTGRLNDTALSSVSTQASVSTTSEAVSTFLGVGSSVVSNPASAEVTSSVSLNINAGDNFTIPTNRPAIFSTVQPALSVTESVLAQASTLNIGLESASISQVSSVPQFTTITTSLNEPSTPAIATSAESTFPTLSTADLPIKSPVWPSESPAWPPTSSGYPSSTSAEALQPTASAFRDASVKPSVPGSALSSIPTTSRPEAVASSGFMVSAPIPAPSFPTSLSLVTPDTILLSSTALDVLQLPLYSDGPSDRATLSTFESVATGSGTATIGVPIVPVATEAIAKETSSSSIVDASLSLDDSHLISASFSAETSALPTISATLSASKFQDSNSVTISSQADVTVLPSSTVIRASPTEITLSTSDVQLTFLTSFDAPTATSSTSDSFSIQTTGTPLPSSILVGGDSRTPELTASSVTYFDTALPQSHIGAITSSSVSWEQGHIPASTVAASLTSTGVEAGNQASITSLSVTESAFVSNVFATDTSVAFSTSTSGFSSGVTLNLGLAAITQPAAFDSEAPSFSTFSVAGPTPSSTTNGESSFGSGELLPQSSSQPEALGSSVTESSSIIPATTTFDFLWPPTVAPSVESGMIESEPRIVPSISNSRSATALASVSFIGPAITNVIPSASAESQVFTTDLSASKTSEASSAATISGDAQFSNSQIADLPTSNLETQSVATATLSSSSYIASMIGTSVGIPTPAETGMIEGQTFASSIIEPEASSSVMDTDTSAVQTVVAQAEVTRAEVGIESPSTASTIVSAETSDADVHSMTISISDPPNLTTSAIESPIASSIQSIERQSQTSSAFSTGAFSNTAVQMEIPSASTQTSIPQTAVASFTLDAEQIDSAAPTSASETSQTTVNLSFTSGLPTSSIAISNLESPSVSTLQSDVTSLLPSVSSPQATEIAIESLPASLSAPSLSVSQVISPSFSSTPALEPTQTVTASLRLGYADSSERSSIPASDAAATPSDNSLPPPAVLVSTSSSHAAASPVVSVSSVERSLTSVVPIASSSSALGIGASSAQAQASISQHQIAVPTSTLVGLSTASPEAFSLSSSLALSAIFSKNPASSSPSSIQSFTSAPASAMTSSSTSQAISTTDIFSSSTLVIPASPAVSGVALPEAGSQAFSLDSASSVTVSVASATSAYQTTSSVPSAVSSLVGPQDSSIQPSASSIAFVAGASQSGSTTVISSNSSTTTTGYAVNVDVGSNSVGLIQTAGGNTLLDISGGQATTASPSFASSTTQTTSTVPSISNISASPQASSQTSALWSATRSSSVMTSPTSEVTFAGSSIESLTISSTLSTTTSLGPSTVSAAGVSQLGSSTVVSSASSTTTGYAINFAAGSTSVGILQTAGGDNLVIVGAGSVTTAQVSTSTAVPVTTSVAPVITSSGVATAVTLPTSQSTLVIAETSKSSTNSMSSSAPASMVPSGQTIQFSSSTVTSSAVTTPSFSSTSAILASPVPSSNSVPYTSSGAQSSAATKASTSSTTTVASSPAATTGLASTAASSSISSAAASATSNCGDSVYLLSLGKLGVAGGNKCSGALIGAAKRGEPTTMQTVYKPTALFGVSAGAGHAHPRTRP